MTKGEHRQRVEALALIYAPTISIPPQVIDQYVEYGARRAWRSLVIQREWESRSVATLSHGDSLPTDWAAYANRASYSYGGALRGFGLVPVEALGTRRVSNYGKATSANPLIYFENQKVYFLPDSTMTDPATGLPYADITGVSVYYYARPPKLFGDAIPDSTDDGLPAFSAPFVHQFAFGRCLEHMLGVRRAAAMSEKHRIENLTSIDTFYKGLMAVQVKDVRDQG